MQLHPHRQGTALRTGGGRAAARGVAPELSATMRHPRSAGPGRQSDPEPGTGVQVIVTVHLVAVSVLVDGPVSSRPSVWLVPCTA